VCRDKRRWVWVADFRRGAWAEEAAGEKMTERTNESEGEPVRN